MSNVQTYDSQLNLFVFYMLQFHEIFKPLPLEIFFCTCCLLQLMICTALTVGCYEGGRQGRHSGSKGRAVSAGGGDYYLKNYLAMAYTLVHAGNLA